MKRGEIIITNKGFEGKNDPTQYDFIQNIIYVKPSYDLENDPEGWMIHEQSHMDSQIEGIVDDNKAYPKNKIEKIAFKKQFEWLKNMKSVQTWEMLKNSQTFPTLSLKLLRYEKILKKYWN